jgi:ribosomal protein L16 Arg81 hydroxylase
VSLRNYIKNMEKMLNERNQELSRYMIWKTKHAAMKEILQSKIQELEKCQNELVLSQTEFDNQFKHFEQQNEETMNKTSANFEYNVSNFQNLLTNCSIFFSCLLFSKYF